MTSLVANRNAARRDADVKEAMVTECLQHKQVHREVQKLVRDYFATLWQMQDGVETHELFGSLTLSEFLLKIEHGNLGNK